MGPYLSSLGILRMQKSGIPYLSSLGISRMQKSGIPNLSSLGISRMQKSGKPIEWFCAARKTSYRRRLLFVVVGVEWDQFVVLELGRGIVPYFRPFAFN